MNIHTNQALGEAYVKPANITPEDEVCEIINLVHLIVMATEPMEDPNGGAINFIARHVNARLQGLDVSDQVEQEEPARDDIEVRSEGNLLGSKQHRTVKSELDQISLELGRLAGRVLQVGLLCGDTSTAVHITALDMIERIESIDPDLAEQWAVIEGIKPPDDLSELRTPKAGTVAYQLHGLACSAWMLCTAGEYLAEREKGQQIYRPAYDAMQRLMVLCKLGFGKDVPHKQL